MHFYTKEFYNHKKGWTHDSADIVITELFKLISPKSVVDIGCGTGIWLAACLNHGVKDIYGIDGDYIEKEMLEIPEKQFFPYDLTTELTLDRRFDLAISLEVAEHLPKYHAEAFIDTLTQAAPIVLFSAAIPHQGGVNHINEQWQDYWHKLFANKNFLPCDILRNKIWLNEQVADHYAQNIILYIDESNVTNLNPAIIEGIKHTDINLLNIVHPRRYLKMADRIQNLKKSNKAYRQQIENMQNPQYMSLSRHLSVLPILIINAICNRIKKIGRLYH